MGRVIVDKSMSLDGFIAGPNDDVELLHDWLTDEDSGAKIGRALLDEALAKQGAVVMGRRTFNFVDNPSGWHLPDGTPLTNPVFVLTHEQRPPETQGPTPYAFVTDPVRALDQAREAAGNKDIGLMGANTCQQYLKDGAVDEVVIHLVPVLLGAGIRLFDDLGERPINLHPVAVLEDPGVTHHRFRVLK